MRIAIGLAAILATAAGAAAPSPAPIAGRWVTEDAQALVEIGPCGARTCGRIVRVLKVDPSKPTTDVLNPDPALRSRPFAGLVFLTAFVPDGDRWRGKIYDPRSGRTYRSELIRDGDVLTVKGCIAFICRTQTWTAARSA